MDNEKILRKSLEEQLDETFWEDLRLHISRDSVITVVKDLDIIDVGIAFSIDDTKKVEGYIETGQVSKPTLEQLTLWEKKEGRLQCLVVSPFVIVQEAN